MKVNPSEQATSTPFILYIDDEIESEKFSSKIEMLEEELSIKLDFASTGEVAIRKLKTNKYDLLITDNLFPMGSHLPFPLNFQDSGIKLIRLIREGKLSNKEEVKNLPIILCTISSFQGDFLSELENLKVTFIKKPVLPLELSNQIKELLKIHTHE